MDISLVFYGHVIKSRWLTYHPLEAFHSLVSPSQSRFNFYHFYHEPPIAARLVSLMPFCHIELILGDYPSADPGPVILSLTSFYCDFGQVASVCLSIK